MWEIKVTFDSIEEDEIIIRGEEQDIPLWTALKYYNLFVGEAKGQAVYCRSMGHPYVGLEEKLRELTLTDERTREDVNIYGT